MSAGDHAPIRSSQHPTTSGHFGSGVADARIGIDTTTGSRGPQPANAVAATNEIAYRAEASVLVFGPTSILLECAFVKPLRRFLFWRNAQTLLAPLGALKPEFGDPVREDISPVHRPPRS